jgi:hypothetical protein
MEAIFKALKEKIFLYYPEPREANLTLHEFHQTSGKIADAHPVLSGFSTLAQNMSKRLNAGWAALH